MASQQTFSVQIFDLPQDFQNVKSLAFFMMQR